MQIFLEEAHCSFCTVFVSFHGILNMHFHFSMLTSTITCWKPKEDNIEPRKEYQLDNKTIVDITFNSNKKKVDNVTLETPCHLPYIRMSSQSQRKNHLAQNLACIQWKSLNPYDNKLSSTKDIKQRCKC